MANISKIKLPNVDTPYNIADKTARSNAEQANSVANQAATDAETAQATAEQAKTDAQNAQAAADEAKTAASNAQSTADSKTANSITMNGSSNANPTFYAATTAGTNGYYLMSNGSGAPTWAAVSSGPDIVVNSQQPTGQKNGDFWYQIVT